MIQCKCCGSLRVATLDHFKTGEHMNRCWKCGFWFPLSKEQELKYNYGYKE